MAVLLANNAASSLNGAISAIATTLSVQTADAALFPSPAGSDYFVLTLEDRTVVPALREIVKVTQRLSAQLTIVRAQEGTTARAWGSGTVVSARLTAGVLAALTAVSVSTPSITTTSLTDLGPASIAGALTVGGNTTIAGTLGVSGGASFSTGAFSGALTVGGVGTFTGNVSAANLTAATTVFTTNVSATGAGLFGGNLSAANITASGALSGVSLSTTGAITAGSLGVGGAITAASLAATGNVGGAGGLFTNMVVSGDINGNTASWSGVLMCNGSVAQSGNSEYMISTGAGPGPWVLSSSIICAAGVSATSFATTSDARMKSEIDDLTAADGYRWIHRARPRHYMMDGRRQAGFIAQEDLLAGRQAVGVVPDTSDAFAEGSTLVPPGHRLVRDYSQDNAYLTAALQGILARLEQLEARPW